MSEFKGTKGPWVKEYDNSDNGYGQWYNVGPAKVEFSYHSSEQQEKQALADANIISAAPDLLEALQGLLEFCKSHNMDNYHTEQAVKVIAKALGK